MFTRRSSLLLLLLPAIGYTFVMYTLIGRTCKEDPAYLRDEDYTDAALDQNHPRQRRVFVQRESLPVDDMSGEIFVPLRSDKTVRAFRKDASSREDDNARHYPGVPEPDLSYASKRKPSYPFNCTNISTLKLKKKVGHGVSKQTLLGEFRGRTVAVKMVTRHIHDVKTCLDGVKGDDVNAARARSRCYTYSTLKLMKEILLAEQLDHPNVAQLLGYCVRSEESDSTDIAEHGVVSIFELGSRFVLDSLQIMPWPTRLRHALEMADLLDYLHHSPLGSLVIPDFKEGHFVIVNSSLKLIDLDDVNNVEPSCAATSYNNDDAEGGGGREGGGGGGGKGGEDDGIPGDRGVGGGGGGSSSSECKYGVRCQRALCVGFNAKENLKNMNRLIFKRLLFPLTFPDAVVKEVGQLNARLDLLTMSAADLKAELRVIQTRAMRSAQRKR